MYVLERGASVSRRWRVTDLERRMCRILQLWEWLHNFGCFYHFLTRPHIFVWRDFYKRSSVTSWWGLILFSATEIFPLLLLFRGWFRTRKVVSEHFWKMVADFFSRTPNPYVQIDPAGFIFHVCKYEGHLYPPQRVRRLLTVTKS